MFKGVRQEMLEKLQDAINATPEGKYIKLEYGTIGFVKKENGLSFYGFKPCSMGDVHPEYVRISEGQRAVLQSIEKDNGITAIYDVVGAVKKFLY